MNSSKSNCQNAFTNRIILTSAQHSAVAACLALFIPLTVSINACLALGLYKTKLLTSRSQWYVLLLTISDGIYGMTSVPLMLLLFTFYRSTEFCALEYAAIFAIQLNMNASFYFILLISFYRYMKIDPSLKNRTFRGLRRSIMSGKLANLSVVLCVVFPMLHAICSTYVFGAITTVIPNLAMKFFEIVILIAIYALYCRLYFRVMRKKDRYIETVNHAIRIQQNKSAYADRFVMTVVFILIALSMSFVPMMITDVWTLYDSLILDIPPSRDLYFCYYLACMFMTTSCVVNAVILIYRNNQVRQYLFARCIGGNPSENNADTSFRVELDGRSTSGYRTAISAPRLPYQSETRTSGGSVAPHGNHASQGINGAYQDYEGELTQETVILN